MFEDLCGYRLGNRKLKYSGGPLTVVFSTDNDKQYKGFELSWSSKYYLLNTETLVWETYLMKTVPPPLCFPTTKHADTNT